MKPVFRVEDGGWWDVYDCGDEYTLVPQGEQFRHSALYSWHKDSSPSNWINRVKRHAVSNDATQKSERGLILEQSIKYHTQQIEHHEMMRKKFEEELKNES